MICRSIFALLVVIAGLCAMVPWAAAQDTPPSERILVLKNDSPYVSVGSYMARIRDPRSDMTSRKVLNLYYKGQAEYEDLGQRKIGFGYDGAPSWFVIKMRNQDVKNEDFVFSLTDAVFQGQGSFEKIVVYGASGNRADQFISLENNDFKFSIAPQSEVLLVLYVDPADYWPAIITPQIASESHYFAQKAKKSANIRVMLSFVLGIGLAFSVALGLRSVRFTYVIFSYMVFMTLMMVSQSPAIGEQPFYLSYPVLFFMMIFTIAVGTFMQYAISYRDKNAMVSVGVPFVLTVLSLIIVLLLPAGFGLMNAILLSVPGALLCLSFGILCLALYQEGHKSSLWMGCTWMIIGLTLLIHLFEGFYIFHKIEFIDISLPYVLVSMGIMCLFFSLMSAATPDEMNETSFDFSILPTSVKNLKEAEEEGEYNRLLTVVERERQMMAELRQIDARRRKEMQKAKESADEANRAKSAFLAVISHEIRTPMTGVMGLVRLLMDTPLSSEQQKYIKSMMESGESMTLLLNDILDFEKIESGSMTLEDNEFDIGQVVQSAATLMAGHAQNKNIFLNVKSGADVPRKIKGDAARLRQVILNLIGNAIKFTEKGGVTVHILKGEPSPHEEKRTLFPISIAIEDTGIGIPESALEHLFNPFSQADKSISGKYGGSGLGLAICKRLIELMGGEIKVESHEGRGSIFTIQLYVETDSQVGGLIAEENLAIAGTAEDIAQSSRQDDMAHAPAVTTATADMDAQAADVALPVGALQIMVVEDNLVSQQVIESFLTKQGHAVVAFSNAEDAILARERQVFDIVFMDWELPGMSGPEAIHMMKSKPDLYIEHAILLTGHRVSIEETGLSEAECAGILNKPIMPEDLAMMIAGLSKSGAGLSLVAEDGEGEHENNALTPEESATEEKAVAPQEEDHRPLLVRQLEELEQGLPEGLQESSQNTNGHMQNSGLVSELKWPPEVYESKLIGSLLETLGEEKVVELLRNVFEKTDEILIDLQAGYQSDDLREMTARAHELKGMAGNFALKEIHALSEVLEDNVKEKAGADVADLLVQIQGAYMRARNSVFLG